MLHPSLLRLAALLTLFIGSALAATPNKIYYSVGSSTASLDSLSRMDVDGTNNTVLQSGVANFANPAAMEIDYALGYVFMADSTSTGKRILRYNLDGSGRTVIYTVTHTGQSFGLALDRANQQIYLTTFSTTAADDRLVRMNYDGSSATTLASGSANFTQPGYVALDLVRGYIYVNEFTTSGAQGMIRFNLDGLGRTVLVTNSALYPNGGAGFGGAMAVDPYTGDIYAAHSATNTADDRLLKISSAGAITVLAAGPSNFGQILGLALDLANGYIYVGEINMVLRYNLDGSGRTQVGPTSSGTTSPYGIALYTPTAPTVSDVGNQTVPQNGNSGAISVTVGDGTDETPAANLLLSGKSSNTTLLPNANITFGGSGANRTVTVAPAAGQSGTATITLTVDDGVLTATDTFVVTVVAVNAPTVTTPTSADLTATSATLGGNVTADGGASITERGVVYSVTGTNNNPLLNGSGVTKVTTTGTTGSFTLSAGSLAPGTAYSFKAYATNSAGTGYSSVGTFSTLSNNADLSALTLSVGTLDPGFDAGSTSYTAAVANATTSVTLTATVAQMNATLTISGNAASSGVGSSVSLSVGPNAIPVVVTAQDGSTTKTYTVTVTRAAPPPTLTNVAPGSGSTAGGTSVVLTGTNFASVSSVTFGGTEATGFTVDSLTQITATAPARTAGAVDAVVTTGAGSATATNAFYYNSAPSISSNGGGATANVNVAENSSAVTTVTATEADAGQSVSFTKSGPDAALFTLTAGGALSFIAAPDFETKADANDDGVYEVTVTATDNGAVPFSDSQALSITVTNVNELPSFTKGADQTLAGSVTGGQSVTGWATALEDGDSTVEQALSFSITANTNPGLFTVAPAISSTGTLLYTPAGTLGEATITVTMSDDTSIDGNALTTASQTFKIKVQSIYEGWATTYGRNLDPLSEGGINLQRFAFGLNADGSSPGPITRSGATLTAVGMPRVEIIKNLGTGSFSYNALYTRRKDWQAAGLSYTVQFSADNVTWVNATGAPSVLASDATVEAVVVRYPFFVNGQKAQFFRVELNIIP